jgi:maleate cis-trans isomerase
MMAHMASYTGLPATSTVLSVVRAATELGFKRIAVVNKWTAEMNATLAAFLARGGISVVGEATRSLDPVVFHRIKPDEHMRLAYELGARAFKEHSDCDAVYIGGGSWLAEPVAARLEAEFGKPVLCNQTAVIRNTFKMLGIWQPIEGHSRVLAAA